MTDRANTTDVQDTPPDPTRRGPTAALLLGSAALMAALMGLDLYGLLPPELAGTFMAFGPPAQVLVVVIVLVEGIVGALLASTGRHPLDAPFITHYGTRTLAAGGALVAAGIVLFLARQNGWGLFLDDGGVGLEVSILVMIVGGALLLSSLAVLASAIVTPWVSREGH